MPMMRYMNILDSAEVQNAPSEASKNSEQEGKLHEYGPFLVNEKKLREVTRELYGLMPSLTKFGVVERPASSQSEAYFTPLEGVRLVDNKEKWITHMDPMRYLRIFERNTRIFLGFDQSIVKKKSPLELQMESIELKKTLSALMEQFSKIKKEPTPLTAAEKISQTLSIVKNQINAVQEPQAKAYEKAYKEMTPEQLSRVIAFDKKMENPRFRDYFTEIRGRYKELMDQKKYDEAEAFAKKRLNHFMSIVESMTKSEVGLSLAHEYSHAKDHTPEKIALNILSQVAGSGGLASAAVAGLEGINVAVQQLLPAVDQAVPAEAKAALAVAAFAGTMLSVSSRINLGFIQQSELRAAQNGLAHFPDYSTAVTIDRKKFWNPDQLRVISENIENVRNFK